MDSLWKGPSPPAGPEWLADAARDITSLGSNTIVAFLGGIVAVCFGLKRRFGLTVITDSVGPSARLQGSKRIWRTDAGYRLPNHFIASALDHFLP